KTAPKVCYFCDQEGHIKKECSQFKDKTTQEVESLPENEEKEELKEEAMSIETPDEQEIKDISYSTDDEIEDT
ncbi:35528_t:CDS:2, partial [Racocetra persica]